MALWLNRSDSEQPNTDKGRNTSARPDTATPRHMLGRTEFIRTMEVFGGLSMGARHLVVLLLDINRFEWVNDAFGLATGDKVLETIGYATRRAAGPGAAVGRLGGDRFGILVFVHSEAEAMGLAREILGLVSSPMVIGSHGVHVTGRIGISPFVDGPDAANTTMRYAHAALSDAKRCTMEDAIVCAPRRWEEVDHKARIRRELASAFDTRQLRLAYQSVVEVRTSRVVGYEALLRWRTPEGVDLSPELFVPVAEELGLIQKIGRWVLDEALYLASSIRTFAPPAVTMAVNLSPRQFGDPHLIDQVRTTLDAHHLPSSQMAAEITESLAVEDRRAPHTIQALRELGCHVGLDDFGMGQSCLSYLRLLPVDFIKIDRSFVAEMTTDPRVMRLVHTIVSMARDLGLTTVAEGVETEDQVLAVREVGCTHAQGFLYGRPSFHPDLGGTR